jgi:hypothetical protein
VQPLELGGGRQDRDVGRQGRAEHDPRRPVPPILEVAEVAPVDRDPAAAPRGALVQAEQPGDVDHRRLPAAFIALSAAFYPALSALVPGIDVAGAAFRAAVQPLTAPDPSLGPAVAAAAREASTTAFHLAMIAAAALLAVGAAVNGFGLRPAVPAAAGRTPQEPEGASPPSRA